MGNLFQLEAGSVLVERYQIVRRIGGGGMGSVYLARDKRLADAYRAVKEMIGTYSDENQRKKVVEDFERESQLLASLDHPAIPTIYDYFITEGCYYLVMKYIGGGDLQNRLKDAPGNIIDELTATEWGIQIADVLEYLHSQNPPIIYRDMKPANVMLDERDRIVLVDFGIARFVASTQKNVTAIGTMGYAPPELFAGKVEARSDIYSLGATLFHLLTGRDPQDNPLLMFDFNRNPRPMQINPKLSEEMDAILSKAVEHKPANRFTSAGEMKQVLERHLRRLKGEGVAVAAPPQPEVTPEISFCGQCGNKVSAENVFCPYCGAPQRQAPKPAAATPAPAPQPAAPQPATLVLFGPNNQPFSFTISKESNLVGRLDTNRGIFPDIDLTPYDRDGKVSRRHAMIYRKGEQITIEDLGSTNGTFVNSTIDRITPKQPFPLKSGDELRLGETTLRFYIGALPSSLNVASPNKNAPPGPSPGVVTYRSPSPSGQKSIIPGAPPPPPPPNNVQAKISSAQASGAVAKVEQNVGNSKSTVGAGSVKNNSLNIPPVGTGRQNTDPKKLIFITNVDFTGQVRLNSIVPLQVGLLNAKDASAAAGLASVQKLHTHDNEISITLKPESQVKEIPVDVYVAAPGFEIEPDIFTRISAPVNGNAPPKIFQLKAVQLGSTTVTVDFYQESDYLSSVTIETVIVE